MKNLIACVSVFIFLGSVQSFSQEKFFYAGDEKIKITPSSDKVVVIYKVDYKEPIMKSWLKSSGVRERFEITVQTYDVKTSVLTLKKEKIESLIKSLKENENLYIVYPVYLTPEGGELVVTDEIIVQFKPDVSDDKITPLLDQFKLQTLRTKKGVPNYYVLRVPENGDPIEIANRLQESGLAKWSQPNFISQLVKHQIIPNDTYFNRQFQLHNTGQQINDNRTGTEDADVDGPEVWQYANGAGVIVAVIDEGVDSPHPDLPADRIVNGYDFGDDDNDPSPAGDGAHGTACSGIVGATQGNNLGVSGIAPQCQIMPIKIWRDNGSSATVDDIADAIDFAWQNGAHVLSNSWGYSSSSHNLHPAISDAIGRATTQGRNGLGSVVVFAAGNTADHVNGIDGYVTFPGNRDEVVTVGASDRNDVQAMYSPTDDELNIVAPSHRAYRCQIAAEDFEVWTTDITGDAGYNRYHNPDNDACLSPHLTELPVGDRDFTGLMGGTSASCPLVAGIAALLLSVNPNLTHTEVEHILQTTAERIDVANAGYDPQTGRSRLYGFGRANAHRAIVPTVIISISPQEVKKGEIFNVKVTGSAPFGLKAIWWFGDNTGIPDIDGAHWKDVTGAETVFTHEWTASIDEKGTYRLGANARDVLYPEPGDSYPHQASEGSGIDYAEIKVVPSGAVWAMILLASLFVVTHIYRQKKATQR